MIRSLSCDCCQCVDTMAPTDCSDDGSETWAWPAALACLTQLRMWGPEHWETESTRRCFSEIRERWLHSAELCTQLTLTLSTEISQGRDMSWASWGQHQHHSRWAQGRGWPGLMSAHVSGCPLPPPGDPDLGEAGARDPVLAATEVAGLAEAARPRLPPPFPASAEDSALSVLASQTPFAQPAKYPGEAGPRQ